jgi:serine/threonine protein kinase
VAYKTFSSFQTLPGGSRAHFLREARTAAKLNHDGIVTIYDAGEDRGVPYIAMELVEGEDAEKVVKKNGPLPAEIAASVFCGIANGLYQAHSNHIIHRDIKLSNIILKNDGVAKLSDFGIVKIDEAASLTAADSVVGTPYYLSPELVEGKDPSPQSDIYAFGISMYYALTGVYPYKKAPVPLLFSQIASGQYVPIKETGVYIPENLVLIVEKCMERDVKNRYEDASVLARDLNSFLSKMEMANDPTEVLKYLKSPKEYARDQKGRNIKIKLERAETFKKKGLAFEALREYESLLELDPDNEEIKRNIVSLGDAAATREKTDLNLATLVMPKKTRKVSPVFAGLSAALLILTGLALWFFFKPMEKKEEAPGKDWKDSLLMARQELDSMNTAMNAEKQKKAAPAPEPARPRPPAVKKALPRAAAPSPVAVPAPAAPAPAPEPPKPAPCFGSLFVFSEMWGDIFLDGVKSGKAPMKENLKVPCGAHELAIENPSGRKYMARISVSEGEVTRCQVKLSEFK